MQQQAYINATIDIRIPTEVEYQHLMMWMMKKMRWQSA
ncbi:Protein of uncharacterised function (DUF3113) [Staphylococcus aureus]|nr:Protein of uncharacterised function (DUF3113) [Staphylococcus aureus]